MSLRLPDLDKGLDSHFDNITNMIRNGEIPHYEFNMITESHRYEVYLIKNKIEFTKSVTYGRFSAHTFTLGVKI